MSKEHKRTRIDVSDDEEDYFKIEDYTITDLSSLIKLIYDLCNKNEPPKKIKRNLPVKLYSLINILDSLVELDAMIGLDKLKEQLLEQLLYFVQGNNDNIMLHTVIEGPPGTGKTSVANVMSNIYAGIGILKKKKFKIIKREDLIGQFLGETTIKTMETLESCKNGVMLIDEAYSLGSPDSSDSYAKEAIDCINQYLSENSDKLICIIAGYKHELDKCFFSQNPGLRRRFPWTFTIENYNAFELSRIFIKIVDDTDYYELDDDISCDYIKNLIQKEYFTGNGGDINNIIARAKIINSKVNFGKVDNYVLTKDVIKEAFRKFYETRIVSNKVPFMMYT